MAQRALIIVPTYNEAANIEMLVDAILSHGSFGILVIDDNSPDGTGAIAERLKDLHPGRVDVIHRSEKRGLGTAYVEGFKYALARDYELVFQMDADFSHDPRHLSEMVSAAWTADVVIGSRYVRGGATPGWTLLRRLISRGGSLYSRLILGVTVSDLTSGFKCLRRDVLRQLDLDSVRSSGFGFQVETNWRCHRLGFQIVEVPIVFSDRRAGQSKMSMRIFLEAMLLVWQLRLEPPDHPIRTHQPESRGTSPKSGESSDDT